MESQRRERGAALIMLIGIIAVLAILATTLVTVLANQQGATAAERSRRTSQANAEGALDSAIALAKTKTISQLDSAWLTPADLLAYYKAGFPGGVLPAGMSVEFFVYDNSSGKPATDVNGDSMMWLEVVMTYEGKTTRLRVLIRQSQQSVISAFPKAVVYSDTGIRLESSSDIYAVEPDGVTPYNPALHGGAYATTVMAGGGGYTALGAQNFTANSSANLAAPGSSIQSVNIQANGSVSPSYPGTVIGGVGLLSDYFDQAAQADLGDEAQVGETPAAAPAAPSALSGWPSSGTNITTTVLDTLQSTTSTTAYTATTDLALQSSVNSGNLVLSRGTDTTGRTFDFKHLWVAGNLTLTGPVTVNATSLYVGGTLTINNATATAVTDTFGPLYVAGTGATSAAGKVTIGTTSFYTGGAVTLSNTATTTGQFYSRGNATLSGNTRVSATSLYTGGAFTISGASSGVVDGFGSLYAAGKLDVSGLAAIDNITGSIYAGGDAIMTGPSSGFVTHRCGLLYCAGNLTLKKNVQVQATALVVKAGFTISEASTPIVDQFASVWVGNGKADWSGAASVRTTNWNDASAAPGPMWIQILYRAGTFNDVYGDTWLTGNAGTSNVAWRVTGPSSGTPCTIMCPLLATTEKTQTSGEVDFGTATAPMVYYMMCDNDTLYSNTCEWGSKGTFYGLMVVMEACLEITGGDGVTPCVVGAVFSGTPYKSDTSPSVYDITLKGQSTVAYNQAVLDAIMNTSIRTTTTVTQIVPGTWQQLATD